MKCSRCGNKINNDITLCPVCGNNLEEDKINTIVNSNKEISISKILMSVVLTLLIIVSIYYFIIGIHSDLTIVGNWRCADYTTNINTKDKSIYYFDLIFDEDNTFKQVSLENSKNSFQILGNYSDTLTDKSSENMGGYLDVYLTAKSITRNGVVDNTEVTNHYDFGLFSNKTSALVINTQSYSAYYCEKY